MLSALYTIIIFGFMIIFNAIDLRHGNYGVPSSVFTPLGLTVVCFSLVTVFGNLFYLAPLGLFRVSINDLLIKFAIPLSAIVNWLLFEDKGTVKFTSIVLWAILPMLYVGIELIRPNTWQPEPVFGTSRYPYPFMDFDRNGVWETWLQLVASAAIFVGICFLTVFFNNLIAGKYKKREA
ncbi:MAG: Pr6Pr family membrane protein [Bacilli bacterium]|nr:Pr6Pr family membrane protein [Bacilli bacterium]